MKNIIITLMLLTLGFEGYSQVYSVYINSISRFAIPEGMTLHDSYDLLLQEKDEDGDVVERGWNDEYSTYIFDFEDMVMTFRYKHNELGWKSMFFDIIEVYPDNTPSEFACVVDYGSFGESFFAIGENIDEADGVADIFYSYNFVDDYPAYWYEGQDIDWGIYNMLAASNKPVVIYEN